MQVSVYSGTEPVAEIVCSPGTEFAVELWEIPSTGYEWLLAKSPAGVELVVSYLLQLPGDAAESEELTGQPCRRRLHFVATAAFEDRRWQQLRFEKRRPWEPAGTPAIETRDLQISVWG